MGARRMQMVVGGYRSGEFSRCVCVLHVSRLLVGEGHRQASQAQPERACTYVEYLLF